MILSFNSTNDVSGIILYDTWEQVRIHTFINSHHQIHKHISDKIRDKLCEIVRIQLDFYSYGQVWDSVRIQLRH